MPDQKLDPVNPKLPSSGWFVLLIGVALIVLGLANSISTNSVRPSLKLTNQLEFSVPTTTPLQEMEASSSQVKINDTLIEVTVAADPVSQAKGLSGHPGLKPLEGMLFIFPRDVQPGFWMKEMNFPLDIIWATADGKIVEIHKNLAPDTYPQTFSPAIPIRYVLEVNAGLTDQYLIKIGDIIHFLE